VPAGLAVLCVLGALFTVAVFRGKASVGLIWAVVYVVLAVIEAFLAYRIFRARGNRWR